MSPFPLSFVFISLYGAFVVVILVFLSGLSCAASMAAFLALPAEEDVFVVLSVLYAVVLCLFCFYLSYVSWFSLLSPFLATMSSTDYFHVRIVLIAFSV